MSSWIVMSNMKTFIKKNHIYIYIYIYILRDLLLYKNKIIKYIICYMLYIIYIVNQINYTDKTF